MDCPFPGMDPYIERSAIWADFHDALIAEIAWCAERLKATGLRS
jgi:Protein of unknown function (DUF4058)